VSDPDATPQWAFSAEDHARMGLALDQARDAAAAGEVPVGAVVIGPDGAVLARSGNRRERDRDPTGHAEIIVLREAAARLGRWRLDGCTLYVTLEPCAMCAAACVLARLDAVVFAAADPKGGFAGSLGNLLEDPRLNHRVAWRRGLRAEEAGALLAGFFAIVRGRG
jgi:tRNA(adenine34) deaminase